MLKAVRFGVCGLAMLLAGTPDGWLMWSQTDSSLYHYARGMDGLMHAEPIGSTAQSPRPPQVLAHPALGASVFDGPITPVPGIR